MGICIIASLDPGQLGDWLLVVLQVALGLGAVIFVHELGHFAVAKMCGVKCEKFFIGFDINGYKISRQWGETEYGIGILPLGGYVKMLGQDDNPANITEQMRESQVDGKDLEAKEITGPNGETYLVDKRSYIAKSVPQRMAIISAGVIMNVIFAVIFAVIAFGIGVPFVPCVVSDTTVGSASWEAGLRPGDEIVLVGDIENPSFSELKGGVTLGDLENGIPFAVRRAATGEVERLNIKPKRRASRMAKVGMFLPKSLKMSRFEPALEGTPAALAENGFQPEDEIIAIDGTEVTSYREYGQMMISKADQPIAVTVRRGGTPPADNPFGPTSGGEEVTVTVAPRPMLRLGLVMEKGKIAAVETGSEADERGIKAGDFIDDIRFADESSEAEIESQKLFNDPVALPHELAKAAENSRAVRLKIRRASTGDQSESSANEEIELLPRKVDWLESYLPVGGEPLSASSLGIAMHVLNRVGEVVPGSAAAKAGLQSSDVITKVEFVLPDEDADSKNPTYEFTADDHHDWPAVINAMQLYIGAKVKLTYERGGEISEATLEPQPVPGRFLPERGFLLETSQDIRIASSFQEQLELGWNETVRSLTLVYRFLHKLTTGQVPATSLGGPVTIAQAAGYSAFEGMGQTARVSHNAQCESGRDQLPTNSDSRWADTWSSWPTRACEGVPPTNALCWRCTRLASFALSR